MRIMAHRGWSGRAPENTLSAIQLALNDERIESIEIDVQLTKDYIPVVIHDFTLNRTTNGKGFVKEYTFEELRKLDAGSWFSSEYSGEKIPSLAEVLEMVKGKGKKLNIELKTAGDMYPHIAEKVIELLHSYQMQSEVYVTSFDHEVIIKIKKLDSAIHTGIIILGNPALLLEQLKATEANLLSMEYHYLTSNIVQQMADHNITLLVWTVDDPLMMKKIFNMHPQIIVCSNTPERALYEQI